MSLDYEDYHKFELRDGLWWCEDENVVSEECTDYDRCSNQCYCNGNEGKEMKFEVPTEYVIVIDHPYEDGEVITEGPFPTYEEALGVFEEVKDEFNYTRIKEVVYPFLMPNGDRVRFANVYEVNRAYGGPEEGGWWFNTGRAILSVPCDSTNFQTVIEELREEYPYGDGPSSVIYDGGSYEVHLESLPAENYPKERPYYC